MAVRAQYRATVPLRSPVSKDVTSALRPTRMCIQKALGYRVKVFSGKRESLLNVSLFGAAHIIDT